MEENGLARFGPRARPALTADLHKKTGAILSAAINVHRELGPGLLESVYEVCLTAEFRHLGIEFQRQVDVPVTYRDAYVATGLRLDFLIFDEIIVELKAVEIVLAVHKAQLLSYLRLTNKPVGLLINFNVPALRQGVSRIINPAHPSIRASVPPLPHVERKPDE
ncbi:MAG TPA: GxxExxY protein [Fimbriimonadaceae bacterium]|nr:GxxExxY protein [Fimbriimonadaceae bacterium]